MTFSVADIFVFMIRRWWKMLVALAIFVAIGVALAFLLPKRYRAEVKLLPTTQETGLVSALAGLQSQLGLTGLSIPGGEGGLVLAYGEILRSQSVLDRVIDSCSLSKRWGLKDRTQVYSRLGKITAFKLLTPEQVFVIEVIGPDNVIVADVANAYADALDYYLKYSSKTRGRHLREFVERRLAEVERDLKEAQDSFTTFQAKHNLPPPTLEANANVQAFAELQTQAMQKELELDYIKSFSTATNPQYENARRELELLRSKLASLPPIASRYLEFYRNYLVQEQVYMMLTQQYEQAKLMEVKDTPLISVLERVNPPSVPYFPQKKLVVAVMLIVGLVLIIAYSLVRVYWEHVLSHPEAHERMSGVRQELKGLVGRRRR